MAQTNPFDQFDAPTPAPAPTPSSGGGNGGVIYSPPKVDKPTEPKTSYRPLSDQEAAARGLPTGQKYQISSQGEISPISGTKVKDGDTAKPTEAQQKVSTLLTRIAGGFNDIQGVTAEDPSAQSPGFVENMRGDLSPGGIGGTVTRAVAGADRRMVHDAQRDVLDALLTLGTGAAYNDEQLTGQMAAYFPAYGDSEQEIAAKNNRMLRLIEAAKVNAGPQWSEIEQKIAPFMQSISTGAEAENVPPAIADEQGKKIAGATHTGGDDSVEGIATDKYRTEDDPDLVGKGIRDEYAKRLGRGDDAGSIIAWARSAGVNPTAFPSIMAQVQYRDKNPNIAISEYDTSKLDDRIVPISGAGQVINAIGNSAPGAYAINAADAATGFNLDSIAGLTGGNAEQVRRGIGATSAQSPTAAALGNVSGGIMTSLLGESALAKGGLTGIRGALAADTAYGSLAGAGMADYGSDGAPATAMDRLTGAGTGAAAGLAGSYLGSKVGGAIRSSARGVTDPTIKTLQDEGIPITVGAQRGGILKRTEDRLAGLPGVGDVINARRSESVVGFNKAAFNRALKPISGDIGDKVGEDAILAADDLVSKAYDKALKGKSAQADQQFGRDLSTAVQKTLQLPRVGDEVANGIAVTLQPYMTGNQITGEAMQQISRELRALKSGYRNDPLYNRIGGAIDDAEEAIFGLFKRNAPEVVEDYNKAKTAARRLYILEDSVLKAKNKGGVFTPSQLGMAERSSMKKFEGSRAAAKGEGPFHDLQRAAQDTLPSEIPDSGTAGRWILPALLIGTGGGADAATGNTGAGLTIGTILAGAYTKAGQRLLTKAGRGVKSETLRALMEGAKTNRAIQAGTASGAVVALPNQ